MTGEQRIPVWVTEADRERIGYWAPPGLTPREHLERLIHEAARALPEVPKPPRERRPMAEVRAQRRAELGGVSPYTAAIPIIPTRKDQP